MTDDELYTLWYMNSDGEWQEDGEKRGSVRELRDCFAVDDREYRITDQLGRVVWPEPTTADA